MNPLPYILAWMRGVLFPRPFRVTVVDLPPVLGSAPALELGAGAQAPQAAAAPARIPFDRELPDPESGESYVEIEGWYHAPGEKPVLVFEGRTSDIHNALVMRSGACEELARSPGQNDTERAFQEGKAAGYRRASAEVIGLLSHGGFPIDRNPDGSRREVNGGASGL